MKLFGRVQVIKEGQSELEFSESLSMAIGIANGVTIHDRVTLHGVALRQKHPPQIHEPGKPALSLVMSPFPVSSWTRLIRCSLTFNQEAGGLHTTVKALNRMHLYCRHMEAVNALEISDLDIYNTQISSLTGNPAIDPGRDFAIPTCLLTLEVADPRNEIDTDIKELHENLEKMLQLSARTTAPDADAIQAARRLLEKKLNELARSEEDRRNFRVDWLSPLSTLNRLGLLENYRRRPGESATDDSGVQGRDDRRDEYALIARKTARKKFTVRRAGQNCVIDIYPWSELLWQHQQLPPDAMTLKAPEYVVAVCHVDSDEKLISWDLYKQGKSVLIAFEMIVPAHGFEHLWFTWIFERVKKADGNILISTTSARIRGYWASLRILAMFPFDPKIDNGNHGDIAKLLRCFRELQGTRSDHSRQIGMNNMPAYEDFIADLKQKRIVSMKRLQGYDKPLIDANKVYGDKPRDKSTLLIRRVWDPKEGKLNEKYAHRFDPNPFSFTKPLDSTEYDRLYGNSENLPILPRSRLAERITKKVLEGENVAIVGAHRSGKTTVLNLIRSRLEKLGKDRENNTNGILPIPVRIHAATTPPYEILREIKEEIKRWLKSEENTLRKITPTSKGPTRGKRTKSADPAPPLLERISAYINERMKIEEINFGAAGLAEGGIKFSQSELQLQYLRRLQDSLKKLQGLLRDIDDERHSAKIIIVVMIDEVGNLADWGEEIFLQAWRYAIESSEYSGIRWIISTSRPIQETTKLSPITNVFNESNVGSLPEEECNAMLDAFMDMDIEKFSVLDSDQGQVTGMRPLLTFRARRFIKRFTSGLAYFLQVFLYHLYDRALSDESPIINRKVCAKILRAYVVPEISDYLESQWHDIPDEIKKKIYGMLEPFDDVENFTRNLPEDELREDRISASALKALKRSGLKGDDALVIAPIVAVWIISTGLHK